MMQSVRRGVALWFFALGGCSPASASGVGDAQVRHDAGAEQTQDTVTPPGEIQESVADVSMHAASVSLGEQTCRAGRGGRYELSLAACPQRTVDRVGQWSPDTLVILGGGLRRNGQANCATAERGYVAAQLFTSLSARPRLIFSGRASRWIRRRLTAHDVQCVSARVAQGVPGPYAPRWTRHQGPIAVGQPYAVSEAETLCSVMLNVLPESLHAEVLSRALFEVRSGDTSANARRTVSLIRRAHSQRVLVLSSPFTNSRTHVYDAHGDRALRAFRGARRRVHGSYALAAVACERQEHAMPYFYFEPVATMPEIVRSRALSQQERALELGDQAAREP
ncbi:MAG: hypothetical protein Q8Q09_20245 [Deltaproteobacteria bacterium]|nr:hypothetical protein [Deltaproteobacteria bacterium]